MSTASVNRRRTRESARELRYARLLSSAAAALMVAPIVAAYWFCERADDGRRRAREHRVLEPGGQPGAGRQDAEEHRGLHGKDRDRSRAGGRRRDGAVHADPRQRGSGHPARRRSSSGGPDVAMGRAGNSERGCVGRGARGAGRGDLLSGLAGGGGGRRQVCGHPHRWVRGPWCTTARDLFEEAGLAPPRTYDEMLAAAAALHDPDNQRYGIGLSTDPGNEAMQTRLESMALANGCNLVDSAGEADFNSPNCLEFLEFEQQLRQYAPEGLFDSVASRALYLSGQAAMYIGGTATLHRMAGLDDFQLATCAECTENPAYLAENTSSDSGLVWTERRAGSARRAHDRRHLGGRERRARAGVRPLSADRRVHRMARAGAEHPPAGTSRYGGGSRALPQGVAQAGDGRRAQRPARRLLRD